MSPAALLLAVATLCDEPNDRYTAEYAVLRARFERVRSLGARTELPFPFYSASEGLLFDDEPWQYGTVEKAMSMSEEIVQFTIRYCTRPTADDRVIVGVRRLAAALDCGSLLPRKQACAIQGGSKLLHSYECPSSAPGGAWPYTWRS